MLKPLNEGTHEEMCVCTGIFGFLWGFPISDRIRELQLLHTMKKKKNQFLLCGGFSLISDVASEKQNLHLCHTLDYSNSKPLQGWSKDFQEVHYSHLNCCVASWISDMEQGGGSRRVWCETQRYRQRLSQFHSAGFVELPATSVRKFFWKRSAKVKETKLAQTGKLVKSLLGS